MDPSQPLDPYTRNRKGMMKDLVKGIGSDTKSKMENNMAKLNEFSNKEYNDIPYSTYAYWGGAIFLFFIMLGVIIFMLVKLGECQTKPSNSTECKIDNGIATVCINEKCTITECKNGTCVTKDKTEPYENIRKDKMLCSKCQNKGCMCM
jgi:hypothetical protein